jgi:hypothetical protein
MTLGLAALSIETGIPMSVLLNEPDDYLAAMAAVLEHRNENRE